MKSQQELGVFLTHEDGRNTLTFITIAVRQDASGTLVISMSAMPDDEEGDFRPIVLRPNVSLAHCIELACAQVSGRLVRDFTRQGRCP